MSSDFLPKVDLPSSFNENIIPEVDVTPPLNEEHERPETPDSIVWDLDLIDEEFTERGIQGKIQPYMIFQICLTAYYSIIYGMEFGKLNAYYNWPPEIPSVNASDYDPFHKYVTTMYYVVNNDEEFECNGTTFYKNETGPLYGTNYYDNPYGDVGISDPSVQMTPQLWGLTFLLVISYILTRLYVGKYNQLLYLVSFKKDKKEDKLVPVKLHFGYTILCNAKAFSSLYFGVMCEYRASVSEDYSESQASYYMMMIYVGCWAFLAVFFIGYFLFCGFCGTDLKRVFRSFRILLLIAWLVSFASWFFNIDLNYEFNMNNLTFTITNIISWCDAALSLVLDVLLHCNAV